MLGCRLGYGFYPVLLAPHQVANTLVLVRRRTELGDLWVDSFLVEGIRGSAEGACRGGGVRELLGERIVF